MVLNKSTFLLLLGIMFSTTTLAQKGHIMEGYNPFANQPYQPLWEVQMINQGSSNPGLRVIKVYVRATSSWTARQEADREHPGYRANYAEQAN